MFRRVTNNVCCCVLIRLLVRVLASRYVRLVFSLAVQPNCFYAVVLVAASQVDKLRCFLRPGSLEGFAGCIATKEFQRIAGNFDSCIRISTADRYSANLKAEMGLQQDGYLAEFDYCFQPCGC